MFCHNCGNKVPDGSKFCDKCGTSLSGTTNTAVQPKPKTNPFAEPGQTVDIFGQVEYSPYDSNITAILSFLFGAFGFHDFYCGNTSNGIIKLLLTITGVGSFISMIWNLIDLYSIGDGSYTDGTGLNLTAAPWAKVIVILELVLSIGLGFLVVMLLGSILHAL